MLLYPPKMFSEGMNVLFSFTASWPVLVAISYSGDQIKNDMRWGMWQVWDRRMQGFAGETWKNNSETVYGRIILNCIFNE